jgi:hypothetical protein
MVLSILTGSLSAYNQEFIDQNIVSGSWPELHKSILNRQFQRVEQILEIYPQEALALVKVNFPMDSYPFPIGSGVWFAIDSRMNSLELAIFFDAPTDIIEKLIILGANVNHSRGKHFRKECADCIIPGKSGYTRLYSIEFRTPLLAALIKQNHEVMQILINYGADSEKVVYEGVDEFYFDIESSGHKRVGNWFNLDNITEYNSTSN